MLKQLELENFKAFGDSVCIDFAPITLIFGENSAGKSSILQALQLLKQTASHPDNPVLAPRCEHGTVDLGSFHDLIYDHDLERHVRVKLVVDGRDRSTSRNSESNNDSAVTWEFGVHDTSSRVHLDSLSFFQNQVSAPFARWTRDETDNSMVVTELDIENPIWEKQFELFDANKDKYMKFVGADHQNAELYIHYCEFREALVILCEDLAEVFQEYNDVIEDILTPEQNSVRKFHGRFIELSDKLSEIEALKMSNIVTLKGLSEEEFNREMKNVDSIAREMVSFIAAARKTLRKTSPGEVAPQDALLRIDSGLDEHSMNLRVLLKDNIFKQNSGKHGELQFLRNDFTLATYKTQTDDANREGICSRPTFLRWHENPITNGPLELSEFLGRRDSTLFSRAGVDANRLLADIAYSVEGVLAKLVPIGPHRDPPKSYMEFSGTRPQGVGYRGEQFPFLLYHDEALTTEVNNWLKRMRCCYSVNTQELQLDGALSGIYRVLLQDLSREDGPMVTLNNVGFGISQLLPIITQSLCARGSTVSVEQPELHVHPGLQAEIADLFIEGYKERANHFIVETHSEHLILRLLKRIRQTADGTLPEGVAGITPDDVSVIYVQRGENGSEVRHLRIDRAGNFKDHWPKGFFEERGREVLEE